MMRNKMESGTAYCFRFADFNIEVEFAQGNHNIFRYLPSFRHFAIDKEQVKEPLLFKMTIDSTLTVIDKSRLEEIGDFDTGNGKVDVKRITDGGYQFKFKDLEGRACCLLQTDKTFSNCKCGLNGNFNMRSFGLNSAMMVTFSFAASRFQTLLVHASLVRQDGYGYAFIAKSGTGKSTQVSFWLRYLPNCDLMNDDNPIIRIIDGKPIIYGGPWSGKTSCYRNVKAPLGAIVRIDRDSKNWVEELPPLMGFASLLPSCSSMKWDKEIFHSICDHVTKIVETTHTYVLHCLPNKEAAEICNKAIKVK
jgi:hypothetical protein